MEFTHFLAMTASEFAGTRPLPPAAAWMACHFSPYSTGLSNLPSHLPEGSLLILNDRVPPLGQESSRVLDELGSVLTRFRCSGLLLDFQSPNVPALAELSALLSRELPCPVAAPPDYVQPECPVFLPPIPPDSPPEEVLAPWQGRELWLETSYSPTELRLTPTGCTRHPGTADTLLHTEPSLFCHYSIESGTECLLFSLRRTHDDLEALLSHVRPLGVTAAVGLYQELGI